MGSPRDNVYVRVTLRRSVVCVALLALAVSTSTSAGVATKPRVILDVHAYAAAGSRVVFEGDVGPKNSGYYVPGSEGLWSEKFGSHKLKRIASPVSRPSGFCANDGAWEMMTVALGAKGTAACLAIGGGISSSSVDLYVVLGN